MRSVMLAGWLMRGRPMVQLECGYCGADVETDDEDDGENLVCPECGEVLF